MPHDSDTKKLIQGVVKEIVEGLNERVCSDYAEITSYNKLNVYTEFFVLEVAVRVPGNPALPKNRERRNP